MKKDIILSGVGGQGILSIATVIGKAALKDGLYMKQAEVHGMSQRGGDVQSNLRISEQPIASDLIPSGKWKDSDICPTSVMRVGWSRMKLRSLISPIIRLNQMLWQKLINCHTKSY